MSSRPSVTIALHATASFAAAATATKSGAVAATIDDAALAFYKVSYANPRYAHRGGGELGAEVAAVFRLAQLDSELSVEQLTNGRISIPEDFDETVGSWVRHRIDLLRSGGPWAFWAEWYARAMAGEPLDWKLQEQIALIDDVVWEAGPDAVAAEIEKLQRAFLLGAMPLSETIQFDDDAATFRVEPVVSAKPDLLGATLDAVSDALEDALSEPSNGLTVRSRTTRVLRRMIQRYSNNPQRVETDCVNEYRSLTRQMTVTEDLPPSEDNLALQSALQEAAQGIRAVHPDIAENRRILTEQALRELPEEARAALTEAQPMLELISEPKLAAEFHEDILYLTVEMRAGPPRAFVEGERNPVLAGYDEKVRVFGRASKMLTEVRAGGNELLDRLEEKHRVSRGDILSMLVSLVLWGVGLLK
ncbi:hypothetical protein K3728_05045 [Rhodobacteraceae bacterium M385]|nr:hypothetical protein K3728_05045 [Rhodobacteraceae bacterium M385]